MSSRRCGREVCRWPLFPSFLAFPSYFTVFPNGLLFSIFLSLNKISILQNEREPVQKQKRKFGPALLEKSRTKGEKKKRKAASHACSTLLDKTFTKS